LCKNTESETRRIVEFLDGPIDELSAMAALVRTPKSIGRWETFEKDKVAVVLKDGEEYLREFGYVS
jgi:hypothetical protein